MPQEKEIAVHGAAYRVWEQGEGAPIGYFAGLGGLMTRPPILERLARQRRVICPSLPGFPGGGSHHGELDTEMDWALACHDILRGAGLDGADLVGVSVGGALAALVAAVWPEAVRRLVLVSPLGLYDDDDPVTDIFAQPPGTLAELACADAAKFQALGQEPDDVDVTEWQILQIRANEATARLLWPVGDTNLAKRLPRLRQPTLILWGDRDRIVPASYGARFEAGIGGSVRTEIVPGAGHLADIDAPEAVAAKISEFLGP